MDAQTDDWMNRQVDGWMDGWIEKLGGQEAGK